MGLHQFNQIIRWSIYCKNNIGIKTLVLTSTFVGLQSDLESLFVRSALQ